MNGLKNIKKIKGDASSENFLEKKKMALHLLLFFLEKKSLKIF